MNRRSLWVCLLAVLALSVGVVAAQEPVTIRIATWAGVDEAAEFNAIIDSINASITDFQIVQEPLPADYYTQIQTQLAGGTAADLMWLDQDHISLAADGSFLPLTECVADAAPETAGDVNDYYPGIIQTAYQDGVLYGLPWIAQPVVVYFNRGLFDAAGLDYPTADWTWDDFIADAKALTHDDQYGFTANGWPPPQIFVWQEGGDFISTDLTTSPIDSPEAVAGVEFYLSFAYNPEIAPSVETISEQGFDAMFKAGKVAMFMGGAADDLDRQEGLDVGVVSVPKNPTTGNNITYAWTASTLVNAATQHPDEACAALLAVTEGIQGWKIVSPRISQGTVEHLVASEPRKEANAEAIMGAAQNMRALTIIPEYLRWNDVLWSEYLSPLLNKQTDLSVADLAAEVRPDLEEYLPGNS
ncbi:MAG: sugar ABC transporter substrate-binding protein [Anaerolineae bacterium]|nr:sugar ABC transporter substrate-binding protein [Anaerolineae bacterium]